jgi:signal transduction histidine kinase/ActR/RegA family two-component response regulator
LLYELGLQATFAVCLWIFFDLFGARGSRRRRLPILCLALSLALWVLGEILVGHARDPEQLVWGRRALHLGVLSLIGCFFWTAAVLSRAHWYQRRPWLVALAAAPMLACYSFLYWEPSGLFVHWTARPPVHGPVFFAYAAYAWCLIAAGVAHLLVTARRIEPDRWRRPALVAAAAGVPLLVNLVYLTTDLFPVDPTPLLLGAAGVALRLSLLDTGVGAALPIGQRDLLHQLHTGVILADLEGLVVDANPAARELLGGGSLVGRRLDAMLERARRASDCVIEIEQISLSSRFGRVGSAALLTDHSDAVRLQQQLQESQKLESLGILAGGIAHDFNNLLTGILNNAALAQSALATDHPAQKPLAEVAQGSRVASDLTGQLLRYSGKRRLDTKPLDLSAHVLEIAALLKSSIPRHVDLEFDLAEDRATVEADPSELHRVVINLVLNAAQAIEGKGSILVRTARVALDEAARAALAPGSQLETDDAVMLEVRDTGRGMDAEVRQRIFEPFFSSKPTGHGLGLAATLGIVRSHRGGVAVESSSGAGSSFRLYFPASAAAAVAAAATTAPDLAGRGRILVVDDEDFVRESVVLSLERLGYEVVDAESGHDAIEVFRQRSHEIDLVLLDLMMPGLSGEDTFQVLREIRPDVPVLLSSGYDEGEAVGRLALDGLAGFLPKPFDPDALGAKVKEVLSEIRGAAT